MAEEGSRTPRIRMPRVSMPSFGRARKSDATTEVATGNRGRTPAETATAEAAAAEKPTAETAAAEKPAAEKGAAAKEPATKPGTPPTTPATPSTKPATPVEDRVEGLQGWMAEIERRQARMTYFGAAGILIAIAAAGAALYFGITAKNDSATKDDLDAISAKVDSLQQAVTKNNQSTQDTINNSIAQLQISIADLQKKQAQDAANISTLQSQVAAGALNKQAAGTGSALGKAGSTTTTTPNK